MNDKIDYSSLIDVFLLTYINGDWLNATRLCNVFKKNPYDYVLSEYFKEYADIYFEDVDNPAEKIAYYNDVLGDVLINPKLAIDFCRWVDIGLGINCDDWILGMLKMQGMPHIRVFKHSYNEPLAKLNSVIKEMAELNGIPLSPGTFLEEEYIISKALTGEYTDICVPGLSVSDLELLDLLEMKNIFYYKQRVPSEQREVMLCRVAYEWRTNGRVVGD